jgi:hypothetical protein
MARSVSFDSSSFNYKTAPCIEALEDWVREHGGDWEGFRPFFFEAMREVKWQLEHPAPPLQQSLSRGG